MNTKAPLLLVLLATVLVGCNPSRNTDERTQMLDWSVLFEVQGQQPTKLFAVENFSITGSCLLLPSHYSLRAGKQLNREYIAMHASSSLPWMFEDNPLEGLTFKVLYSEAKRRYDIIDCH